MAGLLRVKAITAAAVFFSLCPERFQWRVSVVHSYRPGFGSIREAYIIRLAQ